MKHRLAGAVIPALLLLLSISCIKGDPANFPAKDIRALDVFRYAPPEAALVMAIDFDLILRDPELGPDILAALRENPSPSNMFQTALPFYEEIGYIHSIALYSQTANDLGDAGSDLAGRVALLSVEMDEGAVRAELEKTRTPLPYQGYQAYDLEKNLQVAFLGDGRILVGGDKHILQAIFSRLPGASEVPHHLTPTTGTMLYLRVRNEKKGDLATLKGSVGNTANFLEIAVAVSDGEVVGVMACDVDLPDQQTVEALKSEMQKSMPLASLFHDADPQFTQEPWGLRVVYRVAKSVFWEDVKQAF
jgi:hypothetical protein